MKTVIVSGSNRKESGSRKVADYIEAILQQEGVEMTLLDMHDINLPIWSEAMWDSQSDQFKNWTVYSEELKSADAIIVIAAEWNGTTPPSLQNILMYMTRQEVGHKPALLVGVSSGINGAYPIAQVRAFSTKNNRMLWIPDHVIVRNVQEDFDEGAHPIGPRIKDSVQELLVYAKHMNALRKDLSFDYDRFTHGM